MKVLIDWMRTAQECAFRELVAPGFPSPTEEAARIGSLAASDDSSVADAEFAEEAIDGGERHSLIWDDLAPFAERLVGHDEHSGHRGRSARIAARLMQVIARVPLYRTIELRKAIKLDGRKANGSAASQSTLSNVSTPQKMTLIRLIDNFQLIPA